MSAHHAHATVLGPYAALRHRFVVECNEPQVRSHLAEVLAPLSIPATEDAPHRYTYLGDAHRGQFVLDNSPLLVLQGAAAAVDALVGHLNDAAAASWSGPLLHGGAACDARGRAVLLVGPSGSGKSTLTAALIRNGFGYLTDELVALNDDASAVTAFAKAVSLKPGAWTLLPELAPRDAHAMHRWQWLIAADRIRPHAIVSQAIPAALVLLEGGGHGSPILLSEPAAAEAVVALVRECFGVHRFEKRHLAAIALLVRRTRALSLAGGTLTERVDVVTRLLAAT